MSTLVVIQAQKVINNAEFTDSRVRLKRQEQKVAEVTGGEVIPTDDFGEIPF